MRSIKCPILISAALLFSIPCHGASVFRITDTADTDERYFSLAVFNSTAYAIWRNVDTGELYIDKSTDSGISLGQNRRVIAVSRYSPEYNFIFTDKQGRVFVLYGDGLNMKLLRSVDGGASFTIGGSFPLHGLKWSTKPGCLDIAVSEDGQILYSAQVSDLGRLILRISTDAGNTFSTVGPGNVWLNDCRELRIETGADGKEVYVFAVNKVGTWQRVYLARSTDYGKNLGQFNLVFRPQQWGDRYIYGYGRGISSAVTALADGRRKIDVVWTLEGNGLDAEPSVVLSESADGGATFSHYQVSGYGMPASDVSLCVDTNGTVYTAFIGHLYNGPALIRKDLFFDRRKEASQFEEDSYISGPVFGGPAGEPISRPLVAMTADGKNACIIYSNAIFNGANRDLYFALIPIVENHPPVISPIADKTVTAGYEVSFRVYATDPDGDVLTYQAYLAGDIDHDGRLFPLDILMMINRLNSGSGRVKGAPGWDPEMDLNDDDYFTPKDILTAINWLNARVTGLIGMNIDSTTGDFRWRSHAGYIGRHYVTFVVSDGELKDAEVVAITVTRPGPKISGSRYRYRAPRR